MAYDGTITTRDPSLLHVLDHADGSKTYVLYDTDGLTENPRSYDGNVATIVNLSPRHDDVDEDLVGLDEVYYCSKDRVHLFKRYVAMFHPEILLLVPHWNAGAHVGYGFGYVTREAYDRAFPAETSNAAVPTPQECFDAELDLYEQWARGEVYGVINVAADGTEESLWGLLGYESLEDMAAQVTDSPVTGRTDV